MQNPHSSLNPYLLFPREGIAYALRFFISLTLPSPKERVSFLYPLCEAVRVDGRSLVAVSKIAMQ
jgi:hypothetical protein